MNTLILQLLKLLQSDSAKGKARNGNRAITSIGVTVLLFIAYRQDGRIARIEQALGITNAPLTVPFTVVLPSNQVAHVSGKVCESKAARMAPRISYANLNRRFDRDRLAGRHESLLWTLEQLALIRPELRGYGADTAELAVRGLRNDGYSGNPQSREWCVLNRAGWPVAPRAEFLRPDINLVSADASEWQLRTQMHEGFERTIVWALSGAWDIEARTVGFGYVWQFVRRVQPGETVTIDLSTDYLPRELRVVRDPAW